MTLLARMTRLFKADLHGILDGLEEPEAVIQQAIRDMEADLAQQEGHLAELHAVLQRLARETQELAAAMQALEPQIDLCFAAGNETLAKNLVRKRLELAKRAKSVTRASEDTEAQRVRLHNAMAVHKAQLADIIQQLALYTDASVRQPWTGAGCGTFPGSGVVTEDELEVAFLEEKQRRQRAAHVTTSPDTAS